MINICGGGKSEMSFNHSTIPSTVFDNNNNFYFILITITYIIIVLYMLFLSLPIKTYSNLMLL